MKGVIYQGAKDIAVLDVPKPEVKEGQGLIQVKYAGICGGDLGIYAGMHPRATAPLVMGHEFSGVLLTDTKKLKAGTKVTVNPIISCKTCRPCKSGDGHVCNTLRLLGIDYDGGMSEFVAVDEDKIIPVPDDVTFEAAAVIEPVAVAVHSLRETGYVPGDNALIYGCGTIGLVTAMTLKEFGCTNITLLEADKVRIEKARALGFDVRDSLNFDLDELKAEKTDGNGFDWIFDCAGVQAVASQLIEAIRVRGKIVIVAGYKKPVEFPLNQGMFKEVSFQFVRVYRDADFEIAVNMVQRQPDFEKLITNILPIENAQEGFDLLTTPGTGAIKVLFKL